MNKAILLNNNAILHLWMGDPLEACKLLTEASGMCLRSIACGKNEKHIKHVLQWTSVDSATPRCEPCNTICEYPVRPGIYEEVLAVGKTCCRNGVLSWETEGVCCHKCKDDSGISLATISPVIWYNHGLSCQRTGTMLGVNTAEGLLYFKTSYSLYEKGITYLKETPCIRFPSTLVIAAALNHQACLFYEMGRREEFCAAMKKLKSEMANMLSTTSSPVRQLSEWKVFYTNLLNLNLDLWGWCSAGAA